jgi:replication factor A1
LRNKLSNGEYLAFLSVKYEVDPDKFFYALNLAWETQRATCKELSIQCRSKTQDKAVFLILKGYTVIAQFPISTEFLLERENPIKNLVTKDRILRYQNKKKEESHSIPIKDLRNGMSHVNLRAKVLEIPSPKLVFTRFGTYCSVTSALIADETGTIKLCLWNEQIKSISNGDNIQIENARTSAFKGEIQLSIGRRGTLSNIMDSYSQLKEVNAS